MKNVLVTATTFPRWKDDTEPAFVYFLSSLLTKKNYTITVLVPHSYRAKRFEEMGGLRIHRFVYFLPKKFQKLCYDGGILPNLKKSFIAKVEIPFFMLSELVKTLTLVKREKIDFIHAHWIIPQGLVAAITKKLYKTPYIVTAHAGDIFPLKNRFLRLLIKFVLKNCDYCTVNSNATKEAVLSVYNVKNIEIIPMGVDVSSFDKSKKNDKLKTDLGIEGKFILTVGRLAEKKGINYLIQAIPEIQKEFPKTKLIIVGDGPERESLEKLTENLNLRESITFIGKIPNKNLPGYYATADLFVGPSIVTESGDTEGLGIVFLESLASGTPVIGSNVGGIPDIIKNGETGLLVPQKNTPLLAEAILTVLRDERLAMKLVKNGQKHVRDNYSWKIVANKFESIYRKIGQT